MIAFNEVKCYLFYKMLGILLLEMAAFIKLGFSLVEAAFFNYDYLGFLDNSMFDITLS